MFKNIINSKLTKSNVIVLIYRGASAAPKATPKTTASQLPTQQYTGKRRFRLPVEQSADKIVNYCCGANYHDNSLEEIKLGNDEEYPEWIWKLRLGPPPTSNELDPNTKEYWETLHQESITRQRRLYNRYGAREMIVGEHMRKMHDLKERRKYRTLAQHHFDAGLEVVDNIGSSGMHDLREDYWNFEKDRLKLSMENDRPFYPGDDSIPSLDYQLKKKLYRNRRDDTEQTRPKHFHYYFQENKFIN